MSEKKDFELDIESLSSVTGGVQTAAAIRQQYSAAANLGLSANQTIAQTSAQTARAYNHAAQNIASASNLAINQHSQVGLTSEAAQNMQTTASLEANAQVALEALACGPKIYDK